MNKKDIIRKVMQKVTAEFLANFNAREGNVFFDKVPRSRPYFEWDINCGECEEWAMEVEKKLKKYKISCYVLGNDNFIRFQDLSNHVFVCIGRKYYDCECLDGVTRVLGLPIYSRNEKLEREEARTITASVA